MIVRTAYSVLFNVRPGDVGSSDRVVLERAGEQAAGVLREMTTAPGGHSTNYRIDLPAGIIVDVEATLANRSQDVVYLDDDWPDRMAMISNLTALWVIRHK